MSKDKTRVMITITDEVNEQLTAYCSRMGLTKSQFITNALGEKLFALQLIQQNLGKVNPQVDTTDN